ncbi:MAG TPA: hypothetical protein VF832_18395 [Longimicrobiales bacterium]
MRHGLKMFAVILAVVTAAACDSPKGTATRSVLAPRLDATSAGGYTFFTTDATGNQTKTAVIDQTGGFIRFQGSVLVVPPNAVSGPTSFTFRLHVQPTMGADLSAVAANGQPVTVFPVPLKLTLSYARAKTQIPDPSKIVILWVENGIVLGQLPSTPDVQGKKVTALVTHFTDYQPAVPGPCDPLTSPTPCEQP